MNSNENSIDFSEAFKEAKQRLLIPELWEKLGLPGEPKKKCRSPFRDEAKASFSITKGGAYWKDHGTGQGGDIFDFYRVATECDKAEAARAIFAMLNMKAEKPGYGWGRPTKKPEVLSLPTIAPIQQAQQCCNKLPKEAYPFLLSRGIDPASALERMLEGSLDVEGGKLVFNYNTGKKIRGDWASSKENRWIEGGADDALWRYEEVLKPEVTHVLITEGESDAMKVLSCIDPPPHVAIVAAPAASWRPSSVLCSTIGHGRKVVLAFDNDEAGDAGAECVSKALEEACNFEVEVLKFPWKQCEKLLAVAKIPPPKDLCELTQTFLRKILDRCFE